MGGVDEPLVGQHRFNDDFGAVAKGLHDGFVFDVGDLAFDADALFDLQRLKGGVRDHHGVAFGGDRLNNLCPRFKPVEAAVFFGHEVHRRDLGLVKAFLAVGDTLGRRSLFGVGFAVGAHGPLRVHQRVHRDVAALGNLVVVEVMRAGDFDGTGAEIRIGVGIGDNGDQATVLFWPHGNFTEFPDDWRVTLILGVHRDSAVAEHGFRTCRGDRDVVALLRQSNVAVLVFLLVGIGGPLGERVFEVPHVARDFFVLDLQIGNCGFKMRVPVHQALAAVDEALVIHIDKDLDHRVMEIAGLFTFGRGFSARHGKGRALPIHRMAHAAGLLFDDAAGILLPVPDVAEEFLSAHISAFGHLPFGQVFFHHQLRGDACVIKAGLPERVKSLHPFPADQNVHQRLGKRVAHVQNAGDVRRRQHDAIGRCLGFGIHPSLEASSLFPRLIQRGFAGGGVKCLFHRHGGVPSV